MKKNVLLILFSLITAISYAGGIDTLKKNGYTLIISGNDANFDNSLRQKLINTFFEVYPDIVKEYNKNSLKQVKFFIDTAYHGVAATDNGRVVFSSEYMTRHPADLDVVTHEVMHIVQDYGYTNGPWWITEGIADYVRNEHGIANQAAGWKLPDYKASQNFDNSYRVTARFFTWIEKHVKKGTVKKLDDIMRKHTYSDDTFNQLTGKTVEELWKEYATNPAL
ncbi:basic secretory protein-like protein [Mucilaginibacter sp. 44-25]|uniref:basic secretory protein-like protein n=1 Tax=Mucilaginibacter sp. 44-25 TaxID=1895794 RepID=UPI000961C9FF|nr:basic secretory protein-like protein [Mucilaginibacter sp. 44-25]OJW14499.1 MAG: secretory protein [Mucilaginibacter sp. 44-25]